MNRAAPLLTGLLLASYAALAWPPGPGRSAPAPLLKKQFTNSIGMKLVRIPPGKFTMGSPKGEEGRQAGELQHEVEITRAFFLGAYEVTQGQFKKIMGTNPSWFSSAGGGRAAVGGLDTSDFPVEMMTWNEAVEFCKKLSALPAEKGARRVYRLPSEAEWEHACRAGAREYAPFAFGKSLSPKQANFAESRLGRTCKVGSYKPNAWGLYDMHGNVFEWCADWYDLHYYRSSPKKDPPGPATGIYRRLRGGGWNYPVSYARSAWHGCNTADFRYNQFGFRVACDVGRR
jgi:formylglycine-generating enzyme required for sulfatase activity